MYIEGDVPHALQMARKLSRSASQLALTSPAVARCYMNLAETIKHDEGLPETAPTVACQFCGSLFRPDNHRVRVISRMRATKKIHKLLARQERSGVLGKFQQKLLDMYTRGQNRMSIACSTCNRSSVVPCQGRRDRVKQKEEWHSEPLEPVQLSKSAKKKLKRKKKSKEANSGLLIPSSMLKSPSPSGDLKTRVHSTFSPRLKLETELSNTSGESTRTSGFHSGGGSQSIPDVSGSGIREGCGFESSHGPSLSMSHYDVSDTSTVSSASLLSRKPVHTSTPKEPINRSGAGTKTAFETSLNPKPKNPFAAFNSTSMSSFGGNSMDTSKKNKKDKKKGNHNVLEQMLQKERKQREQSKSNKSLQSFLSGL